MLHDIEQIAQAYIDIDDDYEAGLAGILPRYSPTCFYLKGLCDGKHFRLLLYYQTINSGVIDDINEYMSDKCEKEYEKFKVYVTKFMDYECCCIYLSRSGNSKSFKLALLKRLTKLVELGFD